MLARLPHALCALLCLFVTADAAVHIAEILADPPSGSAGDANGDGTRQTYGDEFVELVNTGIDTVSLAGWRLGDDDTSARFVFPDTTRLSPGGRLLLFGGGDPAGFAVPVFTDDGRIGNGLTNTGDIILLLDASGDTVDQVDLATWPKDQSVVRSADGAFVPHQDASAQGQLFSPGRAVDETATPGDTTAAATNDSTTSDSTDSAAPAPIESTASDTALPADSTATAPTLTDSTVSTVVPDPPPPLSKPDYPIRIAEILADPPSGNAGDANGDGTRQTYGDEFIELVNTGSDTVSLAGWHLGDDDTSARFTFPDTTRLPPGGRLLLFGGGAPANFTVPAFADDGRIGNGLTNTGDVILLLDASGDTVDQVDLSTWPKDQSVVRSTDGTFVPHQDASTQGQLFSPGRAVDEAGSTPATSDTTTTPPATADSTATAPQPVTTPVDSTTSNTPSDTTATTTHDSSTSDSTVNATSDTTTTPTANDSTTSDTTAPADATANDTTTTAPAPATNATPPDPPAPRRKSAYPIRISEILADPPAGRAGDANRDGRRDSNEDEFIELHNTGPAPISLAGWRLGDDDTDARFTFPPGASIAPGGYAVLFGGGTPAGFAVPAFADDGRIGNGLTNSGDRLLLLDAAADTVLDIAFASKGNIDQSLVHQNGQFQPHGQLPGREPFSPGRPQSQYTAFAIADPHLVEGDTGDLLLLGHHADGVDTLAADFQWLSVAPAIARIRPGAKIRALRPGRTRLECWRGALFLAQRTIRVRAFDPPNDPPRITSRPDTTAFAGGWYRYATSASDPEHNSLVFTLALAPPWLRLDGQTGLLQGRAPDTTGVFTIAFEAADGRGGLAAQRYRLHLVPRPQVRISEILADPPSGPGGDANGDGRRHSYEDEFVEIHNAGATPVDLGGCSLADDRRALFAFPAPTPLPPDGRAVVFGGGQPRGPFAFAAGGRLGDGLGNRRDALYLIGPAGRDTLARLVYDLRRDPDQALLGDGQTLHAAWPGRGPFSPGAPRPVLRSLRPNHRTLHLVRGERRRLWLIGRYSDGGEYPVDTDARWTPSRPAIAVVGADGVLTAVDTGSCQIAIRLDRFAVRPDTIALHIRPPLAETLRFSPGWDAAAIAGPQPFIVRSPHPARQAYYWTLNGRRLPVMAPQYIHTARRAAGDTIRVEIRRGFETVARQWVLYPSAAKSAVEVRPLYAAPNPFSAATRIRFHLAQAGPARLAIYNLRGQRVRTLVDAPRAAGAHSVRWDGRDRQGRAAATGLYLARLTTPTARAHAKLLLLR